MIVRFKCKRCNKFITVETDSNEDITCPFCGTIHSWLYEDGWGYYEKDFIKKKCPICKNYTFVRRDLLDNDNIFFKTFCDSCNNELLVKNKNNKPILFPYKQLLFDCEWCGDQLQCSVENVNDEYLEKQENAHAKHIKIYRCLKCNNRTKVEYIPCWDDKFYTEKIFKSGRKKKTESDIIDTFINNDFLYNRYGILHPYNIIDFCDDSHYDYEQVFNYVTDKNIEIFIPMNKEEVNKLNIKNFEKDFDKLVLKENAMKEAGCASLSRILGQRKVWKDLRNLMISQNNATCKICGFKTENARSLHIHENWTVEKNIVNLTSVELICSTCHACKHRNEFIVYRVIDGADSLVYGIPRIDFLTIHIMKVNNVSKEVIYAYRKKLLKELDDFERQRIRDFSLNNENKSDSEDEYKYTIGENIPLKEEIELVLREKNLLL